MAWLHTVVGAALGLAAQIGGVTEHGGQRDVALDDGGAVEVEAHVPLSTMFGYATDLRSRTQGRANYSMEPSHYVELPKSLQDDIVNGRR